MIMMMMPTPGFVKMLLAVVLLGTLGHGIVGLPVPRQNTNCPWCINGMNQRSADGSRVNAVAASRSRRSGADLAFKEPFYVPSGTRVYLQRGQAYHLTCPIRREGEQVGVFTWYKEGEIVVQYTTVAGDTNLTQSGRYELSDVNGLVVRQVEMEDNGRYICRVIPRSSAASRRSSIDVTVLDQRFPAVSEITATGTEEDVLSGSQLRLLCPAGSLPGNGAAATVYWSLDNGEPGYTSIVGVRFSDGETKAPREGFRIDADGSSLLVESTESGRKRFWCHLSYLGSPLKSGYIDVKTTDLGSSALWVSTTPEPGPAGPSWVALLVFIPLGMIIAVALLLLRLRCQAKRKRKRCFLPLSEDFNAESRKRDQAAITNSHDKNCDETHPLTCCKDAAEDSGKLLSSGTNASLPYVHRDTDSVATVERLTTQSSPDKEQSADAESIETQREASTNQSAESGQDPRVAFVHLTIHVPGLPGQQQLAVLKTDKEENAYQEAERTNKEQQALRSSDTGVPDQASMIADDKPRAEPIPRPTPAEIAATATMATEMEGVKVPEPWIQATSEPSADPTQHQITAGTVENAHSEGDQHLPSGHQNGKPEENKKKAQSKQRLEAKTESPAKVSPQQVAVCGSGDLPIVDESHPASRGRPIPPLPPETTSSSRVTSETSGTPPKPIPAKKKNKKKKARPRSPAKTAPEAKPRQSSPPLPREHLNLTSPDHVAIERESDVPASPVVCPPVSDSRVAPSPPKYPPVPTQPVALVEPFVCSGNAPPEEPNVGIAAATPTDDACATPGRVGPPEWTSTPCVVGTPAENHLSPGLPSATAWGDPHCAADDPHETSPSPNAIPSDDESMASEHDVKIDEVEMEDPASCPAVNADEDEMEVESSDGEIDCRSRPNKKQHVSQRQQARRDLNPLKQEDIRRKRYPNIPR